jgi:hypothetical protein
VSLDFLPGKQRSRLIKNLKRLQNIQKPSEKDRDYVLEMVDAFIRDRKTKLLTLIKLTALLAINKKPSAAAGLFHYLVELYHN